MQIGHREFTDGQTRPVFLNEDNRQYVLTENDLPIYGDWLLPDDCDEPILVWNCREGKTR